MMNRFKKCSMKQLFAHDTNIGNLRLHSNTPGSDVLVTAESLNLTNVNGSGKYNYITEILSSPFTAFDYQVDTANSRLLINPVMDGIRYTTISAMENIKKVRDNAVVSLCVSACKDIDSRMAVLDERMAALESRISELLQNNTPPL